MAEKKSTVSSKKPAKKPVVKKKKVVHSGEAVNEALEAGAAAEAAQAKAANVAPQAPVVVPVVHRPKRPKTPGVNRYFGTGRRKEAVARVMVQPGSGQVFVNGQPFSQYFCHRKLLEVKVLRPLVVTANQTTFDVYAEAYGGGVPGQADAVCLGLARALLKVNPELRLKLKREGLLRRDPRMKERKKYGLKRARRAFQYSKR